MNSNYDYENELHSSTEMSDCTRYKNSSNLKIQRVECDRCFQPIKLENPLLQQPSRRQVNMRQNFQLHIHQSSIQMPIIQMEPQQVQHLQQQCPPQITHAQIQPLSKLKERTFRLYQDLEKNKNSILQIRPINLRPQLHLRRHFKIQHPTISTNQSVDKKLPQTYSRHHFHHIVACRDQQEPHLLIRHNMGQQSTVAISQEPNQCRRHHRHMQVNTIQLRPINMKTASPVTIDHPQQLIEQLDQQQNLGSNIVMKTTFADKKVLSLNSINYTLGSTLNYSSKRKHKIFSIPV